jgi:phage terminase small subunit
MPMLPDPRHEKIAQALARGVGVGNAYAEGGYKRNAVAASKFCAKPEIKARVKEVREFRDRIATEYEIKTSADVAR